MCSVRLADVRLESGPVLLVLRGRASTGGRVICGLCGAITDPDTHVCDLCWSQTVRGILTRAEDEDEAWES